MLHDIDPMRKKCMISLIYEQYFLAHQKGYNQWEKPVIWTVVQF